MKPYQRVASRYIASSTGIKYEPYTDGFIDYNANVGIDVLAGDEHIGQIEGKLSYVDLDEVEAYDCVDDIIALYELWGDDVPSWKGGEEIAIFEIIGSDLDPAYHNKKIGLRMYKEIASLAREENNNPMFFIPNYCNETTTSREALRVWKSLTRSNSSTSSEDVILMIDRKLR